MLLWAEHSTPPQAFYFTQFTKPYLHYSQADGDKGQALGRYINHEIFFLSAGTSVL